MKSHDAIPSEPRIIRWTRRLILLPLVLIILLIVMATLYYGPQYQLAREVQSQGGRVTWHSSIGGLKEIAFTSSHVNGDEQVGKLGWFKAPNLESLLLKRSGLSDASLPPIMVLQKLQALDLEGNPSLTSKALSELKAMAGLRRLNIDAAILENDGDAVVQFPKLTQLTELYFYGKQIDAEKLKALRTAMPSTKIERIDPTASAMAMRPVPSRALIRVAFHPGGQLLATGNAEGVLRVVDLETRKVIWTEQAHSEWLFALAFNPSGQLLATAGGDDVIHIWDVSRRTLVRTLNGHDDDVHAVAFTPDGRSLVSTGDDMTVRHWSLDDLPTEHQAQHDHGLPRTKTWQGHDDTIPSLAVSANGRWVASGSRDGTVLVRRLSTGQASHTLVHSIHKRPRDERGLSIAAFDPTHPRGDVMGVGFDVNSERIATTGYDGNVRVWDVESGRLLTQWHAHDGWAFGLECSPVGGVIATCGRRGRITLWSETGSPLCQLLADDDVAGIAFSKNGTQLAASTANGQLNVWTLSKREGHSRFAPSSPDITATPIFVAMLDDGFPHEGD